MRSFWLSFVDTISGGAWNQAQATTFGAIAEYVSTFKTCSKDLIENHIAKIQSDTTLSEEARLSAYKTAVQKTAQQHLLSLGYDTKKIVDKRYFNGWIEQDFTRKTVNQWVQFFVHAMRVRKISSHSLDVRLTAERAAVIVKEFFDSTPDALPLFANGNGYKFIARYFFKANMQSAFKSLSALMGERFKELEWQCFFGTVEEYEALEAQTASPDFITNPPTGFKGMQGYKRFVESREGSKKANMQSAFISLSALMGERFKELEWQQFPGTVEEYEALEARESTK